MNSVIDDIRTGLATTVLVLTAVLLLSACSTDSSSDTEPDDTAAPLREVSQPARAVTPNNDGVVRLLVQHHRVSCQGVGFRLCMLVRDSDQSPWSFFYSQIEGFEYEWGYQYELRVQTTEIENPPADASSVAYSLIDQISKVKVPSDTSFNFVLLPDQLFSERTSVNQFNLLQEVSFSCDTASCDSVASLLAQEMSVLLRLQHANDDSDLLRLQEVLCSDARPLFYESCRITE